MFDAETQCETKLRRSIAIQTLAQRKPRKRTAAKTKQCRVTPIEQKNGFAHTTNHSCPVNFVTPVSTLIETKEEMNTSITASDFEQPEDGDYSSSSDKQSDSDDEYVCSESEDSS